MRKLTIIFLVLIITSFAACASQPPANQEAKPQSTPHIFRSTWNDKRTGRRIETTHKIWGPMPRCGDSRPTGAPCEGTIKARPEGTPRKLNAQEQKKSLDPK